LHRPIQGGGAGVQADLRAFAAAGCHGTSVIVALTAQNTREVSAVHAVPCDFVVAQLRAVFDDIGVDAAKTGMLFSAEIIESVATYLEGHPVPLVVDPVMVASSGARLLRDDAVSVMVRRLFPLATVVTPNLREAKALTGADGSRRELAERLHAMGALAVIVTGGHGSTAVDHLFDGRRHVEIPVPRHRVRRHARRGVHAFGDAGRASRPGMGAGGRRPAGGGHRSSRRRARPGRDRGR